MQISNMHNQWLDQHNDKYYTRLKIAVGKCNFRHIRDSLRGDHILCGTDNYVIRERLLREMNLTLDKCLQLCRATELSKEDSKAL